MMTTLTRWLNALALFGSLAGSPLMAQAHEGHDEPAPAAPVSSAAPRVSAQSELFELVAVQSKGQMLIYLDRYVDNSPVPNATIEIESGSWKATATAAEAGTYRVASAALDKPGNHPLVYTITQGNDADLLEATLTIDPTATEAADHDHTPARWPYVVTVLALAVAIFFWIQGRRVTRRRTQR